jgi:hypothetical protein
MFFFWGGLVFIYPRTLAFSTFWTHVGSYNMLLGSHTCHRKCKSICFSSWYIFGKSMSFPDTVFCWHLPWKRLLGLVTGPCEAHRGCSSPIEAIEGVRGATKLNVGDDNNFDWRSLDFTRKVISMRHCLQKRRIFLSLVGTPQECLPMSMQGWFNLFRGQHILRKTGHGIKCPGILDPIPCGCIFRLLRQIGHMFTPYYV